MGFRWQWCVNDSVIGCNKCATVVWDVDNRGGSALVGEGYMGTPYTFAVNLKFLLQTSLFLKMLQDIDSLYLASLQYPTHPNAQTQWISHLFILSVPYFTH